MTNFSSLNKGEMSLALSKCVKIDSAVENVLSTGNLPGVTDLGSQQDSGIFVSNRWLVFLIYNTCFIIRVEYHGGKH